MRKNFLFIVVMLFIFSGTLFIWASPQGTGSSNAASNQLNSKASEHTVNIRSSTKETTSPAAISEELDLDGIWNLTPKGSMPTTMVVPGSYAWSLPDQIEFPLTQYGPWKIIEGQPESKYERTFTIPSSMAGKRLFLHFDAVNFLSDIYLNGQLLGTNEGGYVPFEYDITGLVSAPSTDSIRVEILYYDSRFMTVLDRVLSPVGIYGNYWDLGIAGDVKLIARQPVYINDVYIKTSVRNKTISAEIEVINHDASSHTVDLSADVFDGSVFTKHIGSNQLQIAAGDTESIVVQGSWQDPTLWSPADPQMYTMTVQMQEHSSLIDELTTPFGFREFWINGTNFYLNGIRQNLHGDNVIIHGEKVFNKYLVPTPEIWSTILDSMFAMNINVIRLHQEPAPQWMVDACDKKGMLVIAESAIFWRDNVVSKSETYTANAEDWQKRWIKQMRNHPSIIIWSAENEMVKYLYMTVNQAERVGIAARSMDDTRPIMYEAEEDLDGRAEITSYHYIYGHPNGMPPNSVYNMADYLDPVKPTSYGEFEATRGEIPESTRVRQQALTVRAGRIIGFADLRPLRIDWTWHPNPDFMKEMYYGFVPTREQINFMRNSMNPVAVFDKYYYEYENFPDPPSYNEREQIYRRLVIFNDEYSGTDIEVHWTVYMDGQFKYGGSFQVNVPLGDAVTYQLVFQAPYVNTDKEFELELSTWKGGVKRYGERESFISKDIGLEPQDPPVRVTGLVVTRNGNSSLLNWLPVTKNVIDENIVLSHYEISYASDYSFPAGSTTLISGISDTSYGDSNLDLGSNPQSRFYRVRAVDTDGLQSEWSDTVGVLNTNLITTSGTDFNDVCLTLTDNSLQNAADLLAAVPHSSSVARWNASSQGYEQYVPALPQTNFQLEAGHPYLVNVTQNGSFQVFGSPAAPVFNLITTSTTDFNAVIIPLDKKDITTASALQSDISNCNSVARWKSDVQGFEQYVPGLSFTDFPVEPGQAYYVNVTASTTWPAGGTGKAWPAPRVDTGSGRLKAPHLIWGEIIREETSQSSEQLRMIAYLHSRPSEKLTASSPGCFLDKSLWTVQCGSFPSGWQAGDTLVVEVSSLDGKLQGSTSVLLNYDPAGQAELLILNPPVDFQLQQNYPNPFNASTRIQFQLDHNEMVELSVFDCTGRKIRTLLYSSKEAGRYSVLWKGDDDSGRPAASGVYIILLRAGQDERRVRTVLLR